MSSATVEITTRAKAFSGQGVREHKFYVDLSDSSVKVWDPVAGYYTTCHSLSDSAKARIGKLAEELASDAE